MSSDLIYFVVKERDKEDVLIPYRKKVVAHLQVPVMSVKQKYKVPNLLGNKNKKKVDLTLITVYLKLALVWIF